MLQGFVMFTVILARQIALAVNMKLSNQIEAEINSKDVSWPESFVLPVFLRFVGAPMVRVEGDPP